MTGPKSCRLMAERPPHRCQGMHETERFSAATGAAPAAKRSLRLCRECTFPPSSAVGFLSESGVKHPAGGVDAETQCPPRDVSGQTTPVRRRPDVSGWTSRLAGLAQKAVGVLVLGQAWATFAASCLRRRTAKLRAGNAPAQFRQLRHEMPHSSGAGPPGMGSCFFAFSGLQCRSALAIVTPCLFKSGCSSVGRASRCQRDCRRFESVHPLHFVLNDWAHQCPRA